MNIFQQSQTPLNAAIYVRVSTVKQVNEGFGLDVQKHRCSIMAEMKGWPVVKVYSDEGISGTLGSDKRDGLRSMLEDAKNKIFEVLIFYSLDRLGRTTSIVLKTIEQLTNMGIKIVSCKESIDTSSPTGVFVLTIFAALAQLERDTIVSRMMGGKQERIKVDGECGGGLPYGYCRIDGKVTVNKEHAHVVVSIFEAYHTKKMSMRTIAKILNKENVKGPKGGIWHQQSVHKILHHREKYAGCPRNRSQVDWPIILYNKYPGVRK